MLFGSESYLTELDPTQPILNTKFWTQPDPTQPMGQPNPCPCLLAGLVLSFIACFILLVIAPLIGQDRSLITVKKCDAACTAWAEN